MNSQSMGLIKSVWTAEDCQLICGDIVLNAAMGLE